MFSVRTDWTREEVAELFRMPFMELLFQAASCHRQYHDPSKMQLGGILSVKTGGCSEDCKYCSQSSHYQTPVGASRLMPVEQVLAKAKGAKESGATRFCLGVAWRQMRDGPMFDQIIEMVRGVAALGLEACCSMGMLTAGQAKRLKDAGCYAYSHNIDTSESFYKKIITTRTFQERLETLCHVRDAGITVCCGGIMGMGESEDDRIDFLHTLATLPRHPESVPINNLDRVPGTPLEDAPPLSTWEYTRVIATARLLMPRAVVRFSAGRSRFSPEAQALCFMAGANSIWRGNKLLTVGNPEASDDAVLLETLGLQAMTA